MTPLFLSLRIYNVYYRIQKAGDFNLTQLTVLQYISFILLTILLTSAQSLWNCSIFTETLQQYGITARQRQ